MKKIIYTVHAVGSLNFNQTRTFGWFSTAKKAIDYLKKNPRWIHEALYEYVIIEGFPEGIHPLARSEHWYKWNHRTNRFDPINKPKECRQTICFGMG